MDGGILISVYREPTEGQDDATWVRRHEEIF